jgi:hypothetical protein
MLDHERIRCSGDDSPKPGLQKSKLSALNRGRCRYRYRNRLFSVTAEKADPDSVCDCDPDNCFEYKKSPEMGDIPGLIDCSGLPRLEFVIFDGVYVRVHVFCYSLIEHCAVNHVVSAAISQIIQQLFGMRLDLIDRTGFQ